MFFNGEAHEKIIIVIKLTILLIEFDPIQTEMCEQRTSLHTDTRIQLEPTELQNLSALNLACSKVGSTDMK